jgi:hypothetical protein
MTLPHVVINEARRADRIIAIIVCVSHQTPQGWYYFPNHTFYRHATISVFVLRVDMNNL